MEHINWYPGHMKKTKDLIQQNLKLVDVVIELLDARVPFSSRNPKINEIIKDKPRVIVLNKNDLADRNYTKKWIDYFNNEKNQVIPVNSMTGEGLDILINKINNIINEKKKVTYNKPVRAMVVGVPNVGKSSIINRLARKKSAKTGNKPGVTRGKQWIKLKGNIELLDTPGILWPKFEDKNVGIKLAFTGAIKDEILDIETLGLELIKVLIEEYKDLLKERYKLEDLKESALEVMEDISKKRGFILSGGRIDYNRTARTLLDEFRNGKIGKITLEKPEDI